MISQLNVIFYLSFFSVLQSVAGHILPGPRTLLGRTPDTTTKAIASDPTAGTSNRASDGLQNPTLHTSLPPSHSNLVTAPLTSVNQTQHYQYKGIIEVCPLGDLYCSIAGHDTAYQRALKELADECLLWDDFCSGDRNLALTEFFNLTIWVLRLDYCFAEYENCGSGPAGQAEVDAFKTIKSWMRSPQCISSAVEYSKSFETDSSRISNEILATTSGLPGSCCGSCMIYTSNVEVYYWPEPDANSSCLSIVGDGVNPLDLGATMGTSGDTYWGCTAKTPITLGNPGLGAGYSLDSIITTAQVLSYGGIRFKQWAVNPWSSRGCDFDHSLFQNLSRRGEPEPMRAQVQALAVRSITEQKGLPISTVVSGEFTFTSPSIYANFISVFAGDECESTRFASTMLSFTPGELSTIAGPIVNGNWGLNLLNTISHIPNWSSRAFDFRDLPCPPQSVMEQNWYTPEPGEPYRPFIAMPSRLREMLWFSNCDDGFFTAFDPPKTLVPAAAMNPTTTTDAGDPQTETRAPVPGSTQQNPGASKTTVDSKPTVTPAQDPQDPQAKASQDPVAMTPAPKPIATSAQNPQNSQAKASNDPVALVPGPKPTSNPVQDSQSSRPDGTSDPASSPVKGDSGAATDSHVPADNAQDPAQTQRPDGSAKDPGEGADPTSPNQSNQANNPAPIFDPSNVKPDQMSRIEGALSSGHTAAPPLQPQSQGVAPAVGSPSQPQRQGAVPAAAPAQSHGLGAIIASALGAAPATPEQPNDSPGANSPGNSPSPGDSATAVVNNHQAGPSEAVASIMNNGQISRGHVDAISTPAVNTPISIPPSQTTVVKDAVSQVLDNDVPHGGHSVTSSEAPQVTAAVVDATQSGLAGEVATKNNEMIKPIVHDILAETTPSPQLGPIPLGSSAIVIEGASSVNLGPFVTTIASKPVTADVTAVQSAKFTLAAGAPGVTIDGTAISLGRAGQLVEDSETVAVQESTDGLGGLIKGGMGQQLPTIGDQVVTASPTVVEIAGSTLTPGAPGVTVGGTAVSLNTGGDLVVGSKTAALGGAMGEVNSVATLANGAVISAGGSAATVDGTVVAIPSDDSGFVVNGKPVQLTTSASASVFSVAGQAFTAAPSGLIIGSQTLSPGGSAITLSGTPVSLGSSVLQIGTSTIPIFSVAGQAFTAAASGFAIGSQSLTPGGTAITLSGTPISLGSPGLQIGTSTIPLPTAAPTTVFSVAGQVFPAAATGFAIGSQSLTPGGSAITISGTPVSLGSSVLQIGTSTIPLPSALPSIVFVVGGQPFTAAPSGTTVGSQTLSSGGSAVTLSGTVVSQGSSGPQTGTSTVPLHVSGANATGGSPSTSLGATSSADGNGTSVGGKSSDGKANRVQGDDMWRTIVISVAVMLMVMYL